MRLSSRLDAVEKMILKHQSGKILADIGTDHGYLPVHLSLNGYIELGYACDVAEGPLNASKETIKQNNIKNVIPLLGSGITPICDKKVDMISICGMGGILITSILEEHLEYLKDQILFLQANTSLYELREFLMNHQFEIIDESIVKDAHHIYEIICCKKTNRIFKLSKNDLIFGPIQRKNRDELFIKKWNHELDTQYKILNQLDHNHSKYQKINDYKCLIEGELNVSKRNY